MLPVVPILWTRCARDIARWRKLGATNKTRLVFPVGFGDPAIPGQSPEPVALRPHLTTGLPLSILTFIAD